MVAAWLGNTLALRDGGRASVRAIVETRAEAKAEARAKDRDRDRARARASARAGEGVRMGAAVRRWRNECARNLVAAVFWHRIPYPVTGSLHEDDLVERTVS